MDDDSDWTPAIGWGIALRKAGLRAGIVFVVLTAGVYLLWPVIAAIMSLSALARGFGAFTGFWMLVLVILSLAGGMALANVIVRGLKADSALGGWGLLGPMLLIVTAAEVGACCLAAALRGVSAGMLLVPLCAMILWSWVTCVVKLLIV